jgi:hypothetical protein
MTAARREGLCGVWVSRMKQGEDWRKREALRNKKTGDERPGFAYFAVANCLCFDKGSAALASVEKSSECELARIMNNQLGFRPKIKPCVAPVSG